MAKRILMPGIVPDGKPETLAEWRALIAINLRAGIGLALFPDQLKRLQAALDREVPIALTPGDPAP